MATAASRSQRADDRELAEVAWDLDPLLDEGGVDELLDRATERARSFAERYAGELPEMSGAELVEAMRELAAINELVGRAGSYAALSFSTDTADPERGALLQRVQERGTAIETTLLFFELEWAGLPDERAEELLATDGLDFARHHLRTERRYRPHLLTEPEERILSEKSVSGASAWARLFAEQTSAIEVDGLPLDAALAKLASPHRAERQIVAEVVTGALEPGLRTRAFILNTLLYDKSVDDRLRSYPH